MKELSTLDIKLSYRTGTDDLVKDFYEPCLGLSTLYRRAAGYFTSHGLALAARGIANLAINGGTIQLVASPALSPDDVSALREATENPTAVLRRIVVRSLIEIEDSLVKDRLNALAWMAASGLLQIKLALRLDDNGDYAQGIYHEKVGIFSDPTGNHVAFSGSANETYGGLVSNFESVKAFVSWRSEDRARVQEEISNFSGLWSDSTVGVRTIEFSEAGADLLERFRNPNTPPNGLCHTTKKRPKFTCPSHIKLRDYQESAMQKWIEAKGRGIFAMATGSGKTLTAITLASKVAEKNSPIIFIVLCPFINLCRQWVSEFNAFGLSTVSCFESVAKWEHLLNEEYQRLSSGLTQYLGIVTTNITFQSPRFQQKISEWTERKLTHFFLIADEVHNLGADGIHKSLPASIAMRLGLSATPERHLDPVGTQNISNYFGEQVFEYTLDRAIREQQLAPYFYYPTLVALTDEEAEAYEALTRQISRYIQGDKDHFEMSSSIRRLMMRRARLLGSASEKLKALDRVLSGLRERPTKAIFYCGDGVHRNSVTNEDERQIRAVTKLLGEKHGLRVRTFTCNESMEEREEILSALSEGYLDGVVAIRCLDEGIDIPDLRMGFLLASSVNPRQFIQRRGRLLRKSPGKLFSTIYDFIIHPPDMESSLGDKGFNLERNLFEKELRRILDFCNSAKNGPEALQTLRDVRIKYNLLSERA